MNLENAIEGMLFGAGDAVEISAMAEALDEDEETVKTAVENLAGKYDKENRGVKIIRLESAYQMCSRDCYFDCIRKVTEPKMRRRLSSAALETLTIIAYNQPITKGKIEFVRGVDSTYSISRLLEREFIEEAGRLDAPGRPILYKTTEEFLRCFGLSSITELPKIEKGESIENAE